MNASIKGPAASIKRLAGRDSWRDRFVRETQSVAILSSLTLAVIVPVLLIAQTLDPELAMIAFSLMFFVGALLAAGAAWLIRNKRHSQNLSLWDIAGGLVITGCAASVLAEPDQAAQLFEHLFERRSTSQ